MNSAIETVSRRIVTDGGVPLTVLYRREVGPTHSSRSRRDRHPLSPLCRRRHTGAAAAVATARPAVRGARPSAGQEERREEGAALVNGRVVDRHAPIARGGQPRL